MRSWGSRAGVAWGLSQLGPSPAPHSNTFALALSFTATGALTVHELTTPVFPPSADFPLDLRILPPGLPLMPFL